MLTIIMMCIGFRYSGPRGKTRTIRPTKLTKKANIIDYQTCSSGRISITVLRDLRIMSRYTTRTEMVFFVFPHNSMGYSVAAAAADESNRKW